MAFMCSHLVAAHATGMRCLQIAMCSHKPELPQLSTVPHTDENPTFHAMFV